MFGARFFFFRERVERKKGFPFLAFTKTQFLVSKDTAVTVSLLFLFPSLFFFLSFYWSSSFLAILCLWRNEA